MEVTTTRELGINPIPGFSRNEQSAGNQAYCRTLFIWNNVILMNVLIHGYRYF